MFAVAGVAGRTVTGVGCLQVDALRTGVTNVTRRRAIIHSFCFVFLLSKDLTFTPRHIRKKNNLAKEKVKRVWA